MFIGIDDTDSPAGMCTTYLGAVLGERLREGGMEVVEMRLVRLNPNAPYKTRGNATVCIEARGDPERAFGIAAAAIDEFADLSCENTNPGLVVVEERPDPAFYWKAVRHFCSIEEACDLLEESAALYRGWKNGRGLIGATAGVASELPDRTWELLAYRRPECWGTRRAVERSSVFAAEAATYPHTWDSVDRQNGVVVCVPHTPDPVLYGIRGESAAWVQEAGSMIRAEEPERLTVWITNQGTDAHLIDGEIGTLLEGRSYRVRGRVAERASTGEGGHVRALLEDGDKHLACMAFEPTKGFREVVRGLVPGDTVLACGSCRHGALNLEKIRIDTLSEDTIYRPPLCPTCGSRMTSAGREKGYKCRKCGARAQEPETSLRPRSVQKGWFEVPPVARRHLSRPQVREGLDQRDTPLPLDPIETSIKER
ncbi:tRNA(Ile)(2)-agmatinylcytidine synthase [Methanofollis fontis]|uniref:tRNA(Ile2) 2-agmatinylcytidine synthetase TiaS n=1 Tax=Methanofollis fontis TaxID=2052832 RepID=A0A483CYN9_9EURY|nr:tRNA(Ile)(2)-agmatinylcytidine synthase [Methanofollis fontis]TAJ45362.1 tRNA(Ile2) 2-agmatinylcytidine synthetase [Methanofollis fontis]